MDQGPQSARTVGRVHVKRAPPQFAPSPRLAPRCSHSCTVSWPPSYPNPRCGWHAAWMGYVVFGAGAIGAVVGGRLFQAGFEVTLIARGVHLQALQTNGLRLESPAGNQCHLETGLEQA